ncbi:MAG: hypothetical protein Q8J64_06310, partial [Thermodesulfovibrionales bacterium]|nr:hypothetical protein [Thermodesulfovibrionales bacterium]
KEGVMVVREYISKIAVKELISKTHALSVAAMDAVDMLQGSLIYGNLLMLEDLKDSVSRIRADVPVLVKAFTEESRDSAWAESYRNVPGHLSMIGEHLEGMAQGLSRKVTGGILFSDKAVGEANFLFERIKDILQNTSDMILARNDIVANYIASAEADIVRAANDFSTKHEERLIEGICMPQASAVYINLLNAIKAVAWQAKEIARELRSK